VRLAFCRHGFSLFLPFDISNHPGLGESTDRNKDKNAREEIARPKQKGKAD
jgi:hypothetical protein